MEPGSPFHSSDASLACLLFDVKAGHDALEDVVWLGPHDQVAVGDHMRWNPVDHQLLGLGAPGVEVIAIPVRGDGRLHAGRVDTRPYGNLPKHGHVGDVASLVP